MMRVLVNQKSRSTVDGESLRKACLRAMKAKGVRPDALLSVTLLSEREMRDLNLHYLGRDRSTDVLAFPMGEEGDGRFMLGDVVVCPAYVRRHRGRYGVEAGRELELVAVHGLLHLLGYDDEDEEGAESMDREARRILGIREGEQEGRGVR